MSMKTSTHIKIVIATLLLIAATQAREDIVPQSWKSGETTVTLSRDGTFTVSGGGAMASYYDNFPLPPWHSVRDSITGLVIEEGVTAIGGGAFLGCTGLTSVTIPGSVMFIENGAFSECTGLTSVTIPGSVAYVGRGAFSRCTGLASVTIPGSVTDIGEFAFAGCTGLTSITVAADNAHYSSGGGVLFNKDKTELIQYPPGRKGAYTIPGSVTSIKAYAFADCERLTSVTIPRSVTSIEEYTFERCERLASVTIPGSVTSIGPFAFDGCVRLASITIPGSVTEIGDGAFSGCNSLTSVTIPRSVISIGSGAFGHCSSLTSIKVASDNANYSSGDGILFNKNKKCLITYPAGKLGAYAIPDSVTSIEKDAFVDCAGLTSVTIPGRVTVIGERAFRFCAGLTSVAITSCSASIGGWVFSECPGLTSITAAADNTHYSSEDGVLFNKNKTALILYPPGKMGAYTIPGGVESIGDMAFYERRGLTSVTIPNSVTVIGKHAFWFCPGLTSLTIPSSVTSIDYSAFEECSGLTSVTIPGSVKSIGSRAFAHCSGLTSVTIESGVGFIGSRVLYGCENLTSLIAQDPKPPQTEYCAFDNIIWRNRNACLYVPASSIDAYRAADEWKRFDCIKPIASDEISGDITTGDVKGAPWFALGILAIIILVYSGLSLITHFPYRREK